MDTAFRNGPGLYSVFTKDYNPRVPENKTRVYCVRLEAYDLDSDNASGDMTSFEVLFYQANNNPEIAFALLKLGEAINSNAEELKKNL